MAHGHFFLLICLYVFICVKFVNGERLHEQIYSSIEGGAACFRRLNGTHQTGCSSSDKGAVGVVHIIKDVNDAQWLVYNSSAGPYIGVINTDLFHDVIEMLMEHPENVAGILLYDSGINGGSAFTQESKCPNEYSSGPGSQCSSSQAGHSVWNEKGTGLLRRDIPFPIFFLSATHAEEIKKIEKCHERYNYDRNNQKGRPLCSIQLNSFMFAAVSSAVCLRRSATSAIFTPIKVCDPLSDHNVYYSLFPRKKEKDTKKKTVTLVTARIDTASLFDGVAPGAASSVVGMVTLITAATALSKMINANDSHLYDHNVLWTLFNGEAFDYIGSQRVAFDMSRGAWPAETPLSPTNIRLHIEIGQIGGSLQTYRHNTSWPLYAYAPYNSLPPDQVQEFLRTMSTNANEINMTLSPILTSDLPPSSLHSFRRILKNVTESGELPEVLLVDFQQKFTNMYYHSALDKDDKIDFHYHNISIGNDGTFISTNDLIENGTMKITDIQVKISRLAAALSQTLYQQIVGKPYTSQIPASAHLVDEMLYCFLRSQACRLLMAADYASSGGGPDAVPDSAAPLYVNVASWAVPAVFAGHLLALLTGTPLPHNRTVCDTLDDSSYSYYWLRGWNHSGVCIQTTMNFSQAVSPAFIVPDYDFTSGWYSTWTESVWQPMWARVFVSAGGGGARAAAAGGALACALAAALTLWLQRRANIVFAATTTAANSIVNDDAASGILRTVNC